MNTLGIIVPYRDREDHLKKFVPHINSFLKDKIKFKILIVEQNGSGLFNRGKLKNVGFNLLKDECSYYCFHDIDHMPVTDNCDYSYSENVIKLANRVSQFNFMTRPPDELAGVILFNKSNFISTNGFSNDYLGWGLEDTDLGLRCKRKNIAIEVRDGTYISLPHATEGDTHGASPSPQLIKNKLLFTEVSKNNDKLFFSGLSNLDYSVELSLDFPTHRHVKVNI